MDDVWNSKASKFNKINTRFWAESWAWIILHTHHWYICRVFLAMICQKPRVTQVRSFAGWTLRLKKLSPLRTPGTWPSFLTVIGNSGVHNLQMAFSKNKFERKAVAVTKRDWKTIILHRKIAVEATEVLIKEPPEGQIFCPLYAICTNTWNHTGNMGKHTDSYSRQAAGGNSQNPHSDSSLSDWND